MRLDAMGWLWRRLLPTALVSAAIGLLMMAAPPSFPQQTPAPEQRSSNRPVKLPLFFVANEGDGADAGYVVSAPDLKAYFKPGEAVFRWRKSEVRLRFAGSNPRAVLEAMDELPGRANFIIGGNPRGWKTDLPVFGRVVYRELYPGIDMIYGGFERRVKAEFVVAPGADPFMIRLVYDGVDRVSLASDGALVLATGSGELREEPPETYQTVAGERVRVESAFRFFEDGSTGFEIAAYDRTLPLTIDPVITYSTYIGGTSLEGSTGIAVDGAGSAYITGWTDSLNFPTVNPRQVSSGGVDAFVVKLNSAGNSLLYATYIGGNGDDRSFGIAVDAGGNAVITGWTGSSNFPLSGPVQGSLGGGRDAFVLKLNSTGTAVTYSTFLGGNGNDCGNAVAVDTQGNAYVVGDTTSTNFPRLNAFQNLARGGQDAFVAKLSPFGVLQYSTLLGGQGNDRANAVAVDLAGAAYVTGSTDSRDFPTANAFQPASGGGQDAFVTKLSTTGSSLVYSTYLGGSGGMVGASEAGNGIAVDNLGSAYVAGVTSSTNFPAVAAFQPFHAGGMTDAFVAKLQPSGMALAYSTYLGGASADFVAAIQADPSGNAYVTGYTASPNFPTAASLQATNAGGYDAFVTKLATSSGTLAFSTYLGGMGLDGGTGLALDKSNSVYVAGQTQSYNFPTQNAFRASSAGGLDAFVTKLGGVGPSPPSAASVTPFSGSGGSQIFSFLFSDANGFQDISKVSIIINAGLDAFSACYVHYDRLSNALYLINDNVSGLMGPLVPGGGGSVQNSQCSLSAVGSSVSGSGNYLTLGLAMMFKSSFSGTKKIHVWVQDTSGLVADWQQLGTWTVVSGSSPTPPSPVSVTPFSGSGGSQIFSFLFSDANGFQDISKVSIIINAGLDAFSACYVHYDRLSNALYLINDNVSGLMGPLVPGGGGSVQNSQCSLSAVGSSVSGSGNYLTLGLAMMFKSSFSGTKKIHVWVQDTSGLVADWQQTGTWTVP